MGSRRNGSERDAAGVGFFARQQLCARDQQAARSAERTIAILSPDYLKSRFAAPEWAAAFAQDPEGLNRSLIPVRVRDCVLEGMLKTVVYIDLVGVDEATARKRLMDGVSKKRGKPELAPAFPGEAGTRRQTAEISKPFPGQVGEPSSFSPAVASAPSAGLDGADLHEYPTSPIVRAERIPTSLFEAYARAVPPRHALA
jgi:hypothetical protein